MQKSDRSFETVPIFRSIENDDYSPTCGGDIETKDGVQAFASSHFFTRFAHLGLLNEKCYNRKCLASVL